MKTIKLPLIISLILLFTACSVKKPKEEKITLESGLSYVVLKKGDGEKPTINDKVKTHYHGTLPDGTVFDSSYDRGTPLTFPLNRVIKGWQEGIQLMKVGAIYKFYIPSKLAYGSRGAGKKIGPDQDLIFKVELLEIVK